MKDWGSRILSLAVALGFCFALDRAVAGTGEDYLYRMAYLAGLYVVLAVSLNIINGICGQFSIGHAAFYQVGAYVAGYASVTFLNASGVKPLIWVLLMIPIGALAAGVVGFVVGLPSLKLRGDYLAIVTLGFGEIIRIVTINIQEIGASYGLLGVANVEPLWAVWFLAIATIAVSRNLLKSAHGLSFLAVREDEVAASAMGVNVTKTKVTAFVLGSMFAGAAGVLLAHFEGFVSPDSFKMEISFIILTMVVLGGTGSITGSALAAIALFLLPEVLRELKGPNDKPLLVTAGSIIATMIAVVFVVAWFKRIQTRHHRRVSSRVYSYIFAMIAGGALQWVLSFGFNKIPKLAEMSFEASQLRMVIFAGTLIIVMLLRPQGILGHHEFSWDWLKRVLRGRRQKEVAA